MFRFEISTGKLEESEEDSTLTAVSCGCTRFGFIFVALSTFTTLEVSLVSVVVRLLFLPSDLILCSASF